MKEAGIVLVERVFKRQTDIYIALLTLVGRQKGLEQRSSHNTRDKQECQTVKDALAGSIISEVGFVHHDDDCAAYFKEQRSKIVFGRLARALRMRFAESSLKGILEYPFSYSTSSGSPRDTIAETSSPVTTEPPIGSVLPLACLVYD